LAKWLQNREVAMNILISPGMLKSIFSHIEKARGKHEILDVYKAAEMIRLEHIDDNVALEDIIEKIVLNAGSSLPIEFKRSKFGPEEVTEVINGSQVEVLIEEDDLAIA
jgi:hypothetical protein